MLESGNRAWQTSERRRQEQTQGRFTARIYIYGTATQHRGETATKATVESADPVVNFWLTYQQKVEIDPVPTEVLTSFLGFVIGDFLAQKTEGREYDFIRCIRLGAYGLFLDWPNGHWWYTILDRFVELQDPRGTKALLLKRRLTRSFGRLS